MRRFRRRRQGGGGGPARRDLAPARLLDICAQARMCRATHDPVRDGVQRAVRLCVYVCVLSVAVATSTLRLWAFCGRIITSII